MLRLYVLFLLVVAVVGGCSKPSFVETEAQKIAAEQAKGPQEQCAFCGRSFPEGSLKRYQGKRACMTCIDAQKEQ